MRIGSLFSGAGGLDMAVEQFYGGRTIWHCETDPAASKVLAYRWPGVPNLGDITAVDWSTAPPVDVLCGGWPCQPFSIAGQRKGIDDERALWPYVARAIRALRPKYVVLENVSAVLTAGEFDRVAADLAGARYDLRWTCLRASDVGAPHQRNRLFILAYAADSSCDRWDEGLPESTQIERRSDAAVSGDGPVDVVCHALLPTPKSSDSKRNDCPSERERNTPSLASISHYLPTPNASDATGGGTHPDNREGHSRQLIDYALVDSAQWEKYAPAIERWEAITRPAPEPTEPNRNGNPRLAAVFSEWMQGWPAAWCTDPAIGITRNQQLQIIGNGVVPQQAKHALHQLHSLEGVNP